MRAVDRRYLPQVSQRMDACRSARRRAWVTMEGGAQSGTRRRVLTCAGGHRGYMLTVVTAGRHVARSSGRPTARGVMVQSRRALQATNRASRPGPFARPWR